ncbi:MAG: sulfatase-like hydrolase/transferase [Planctomycetales bacterium]|nr:sulfatase-like hydrolase/transferase [Planctomycetales bacterium]
MKSIPFASVRLLFVCVFGFVVPLAAVASAAAPPNIVLIYIDNVGYGDIGCYGNPVVRTPNIDRLAHEGVRCTDFYIVTSSCTPSRGALLTGRYPLRNGLTHQLGRDENWTGVGLRHTERIMPQYLKSAGYATGCFGKWNLGFADGSRPTERGFDEFLGCRSGNIDYYTHVYNGQEDLYRDTTPVEAEGYSTELFADAACDFIRRNQQGPFFVYVPFNAAHVPNFKNKAPGVATIWQAPAKYFEQYGYAADSTDSHEGYHAVLSALDAGIGQVVQQVDELGLRENTIVIVASDNGALASERLPLETGTNGPFRGGRTQTYEGGIRTACVVRWPERLPAGSLCREPLSNIDVLPMLLSAAEVPLPTDRTIDGRDPTETLLGEAPSPHEFLFFEFRNFSGARKGRWKIVRTEPKAPFELYDLRTDWGETKDLAEVQPQIRDNLVQAFESWRETVQQP